MSRFNNPIYDRLLPELEQQPAFFESVRLMREAMAQAPALYRPAEHWMGPSEAHLAMVSKFGLGMIKRTVNQDYFQMNVIGPGHDLFKRALELWPGHGSFAPFFARLEDGFMLPGPEAAAAYSFYVSLLWEFVLSTDRRGQLETLDEPMIGSPYPIMSRGRLISQDLAHSYREYATVLDEVGTISPGEIVAELGAGYGRLAYVFGKLCDARYWIVDIPPTLAISQWYLEQVFPGERIFRFRPFSDYREIAAELSESRFAFFLPAQIELLPQDSIDHFLSISSLHEMTIAQVRNYLAHAARLSRRSVYLKQWTKSVAVHDGRHVVRDDYQLTEPWVLTCDRPDLVVPDMFERVFRRLADGAFA